jgi:hypothetical protein
MILVNSLAIRLTSPLVRINLDDSAEGTQLAIAPNVPNLSQRQTNPIDPGAKRTQLTPAPNEAN